MFNIKNPVILVDGSYYLYRAYYTFPLLQNKEGEYTGAIFGVLNILKNLIIHYQPSHIVVVFDSKGKTFRNKLFEHYKSNRPPMPKKLLNQIIPLHNIIKAMGLPLIAIEYVEADDVIGTLALIAVRNNHHVLISTGDKDMAQLVSSHINLINTISSTLLGPKEIQLKFGIPPKLIIDYLALIGDSSDNIPGVPGIGKKIAQLLLQQLGGLQNVYQQLEHISTLHLRGAKTVIANLKQYREIAFLSYELAKIKTDVVLHLSYDQLLMQKPQFKTLVLLLQRYELEYWLNNIETDLYKRI